MCKKLWGLGMLIGVVAIVSVFYFMSNNTKKEFDQAVWDEMGFSQEQKVALNNCREYLKQNPNFKLYDTIDYKIVRFINCSEQDIGGAYWIDDKKDVEVNSDDWIIHIGSDYTGSGHDYMSFVVDKDSQQVLGYFPRI